MPRIIVQALSGRTLEQKRNLVRDITEAVCRNFKVDPEHVSIVIQEATTDNMARGGILLVDQGLHHQSSGGDSADTPIA